MFAVAFEVLPSESGYQQYLDLAAELRPRLEDIDGFSSIERFKSLTRPGWILSLSLWRDEAALIRWRQHGEHHAAQARGREDIFSDYRIRVVRIATVRELCDHQPLLGFCALPPENVAGTLYESLTQAGKRMALHDLADADMAQAWESDFAAPSQPFCGTVLRDYGMFDRRQAPQHFPAKAR